MQCSIFKPRYNCLFVSHRLYFDIREDQWPLVYDDKYNVSFCGFEKFHVFDAKKWRNIIQVCL